MKETVLGSLPAEWDVLPIGDFAYVTKLAGYEYTKHFKYIDDGEVIALRALNVREGRLDLANIKRISKKVSDALPRSKLLIGDILFTYVGANIGQFALIQENEKYHLAPNICLIRATDKGDYYFLYSYFRTNYFRENLSNYSVGSSQPTLPMGNIRKILIPVPSIKEQKAIAAVLSRIDDKIDLLHCQNKTLEAMAETLFRQWFIVEAKEDWVEIPLGQLFDISSGKGLKKEQLDDNGLYSCLGANGEIGRTNDYLFDEKLLFTGRVGTLGNVFIVENKKVWLSDNTLIFTKIKHFYFVYFLLKTARLADYNAGSTQPLIRQSDIKEIPIIFPDKEKLGMFEIQSGQLFEKIKTNNKQIKTLEKLRDTLLPKLMSGEVRVAC